MSESYDVAVIGGGVVGAATAFNLARLGARKVLLLERDQTCSGGTAKSCAIVRTHYSIPSNTRLAMRSLDIFENFVDVLGDEDAESGFVNSGYLILAPEGKTADTLTANLAMQADVGADTRAITREEAGERHPLLALDDIAAIGYEPRSGYADGHKTTYSYVRAALKLGVDLKRHRAALGLLREGDRITGVHTYADDFAAGAVVVAMGPWSHAVSRWTGLDLPLEISQHKVLTLGPEERYDASLPVVKDLSTENKMYFRPTTGGAALVGTGDHGDPVDAPGIEDQPIDMEFVSHQGRQMAHRMPSFAEASLYGSLTGPYDITPDWNPVLGPVSGLDGLFLAYGFSGHGFKLAPALGEVLAQAALGLETDVDLAPYRLERFAEGDLLTGAYGIGSIS
jgi:glycine/D-amino acid oxidase-like deaminating enzyme